MKVPLHRLVEWGRQLSAAGLTQNAEALLADFIMVPLESFFRDADKLCCAGRRSRTNSSSWNSNFWI